MKAFQKFNGEPKTHRKPRTCKYCKENIKGACLLPFRKVTKVREYKKYFAKFTRADILMARMR